MQQPVSAWVGTFVFNAFLPFLDLALGAPTPLAQATNSVQAIVAAAKAAGLTGIEFVNAQTPAQFASIGINFAWRLLGVLLQDPAFVAQYGLGALVANSLPVIKMITLTMSLYNLTNFMSSLLLVPSTTLFTTPTFATGALVGTVSSSSGGGIANALITLSPGSQSTATATDGSFGLAQLGVGTYSVSVSALPTNCVAPSSQTAVVDVGATVTVNFNVSCSSSPTSLVAYYPFDGNSNDASGNGFDATFNNAQLATGVSGQSNTAYHFNGTSEIRLPATPTNSLTAGTVSVWARLDDTNAQYNFFAKVPSAGTYPMRVQFGGAASGAYAPVERWCFIVNTQPPGDCTTPAYSFTPTSSLYDFTSWHLYTFTWNSSGRQIYRDGFLISTITAPATSPPAGELVLSPPSTSAGGVPERLKGSLDDLRIYNYALSASEVAALYTTPPGPAPVSGGRIAFMSVQPSGVEEIVAMDTNGGQRTQLTFRGLHSESPQWSPDGSQIAYQGDVTSRQNFEIHVMNADGSNDHVVSPDPSDDAQPFWSPDGKQIVFQSRRAVGACAGQGTEYKIYVMDVSGANLTCLGFQGVQSETPSFSPDGSKITYFVNLGPGQAEIWVMNANGSNKVRLTSGAQDFFPRWSPDGTQILFERNAASICVMSANGSGVNCVASGRYPSWSPSSGHIVFTNVVGGVEQIFRVARTGGAVVRVATTSTRDLEPVWTH